jgi:hypothetical protein
MDLDNVDVIKDFPVFPLGQGRYDLSLSNYVTASNKGKYSSGICGYL